MGIIKAKDLIEGDVFELLGLQNLPEKRKEELMAKIIEGVESRVVLRIDDIIADEEREKFHQLLDQGTDQEIDIFMKDRGINVAQLAAEEALFLKNDILQNTKALKE